MLKSITKAMYNKILKKVIVSKKLWGDVSTKNFYKYNKYSFLQLHSKYR